MAQNPDYIPPFGSEDTSSAPVPPPPQPQPSAVQDVDIRSMSGDFNALQSSGGLGDVMNQKTFNPGTLSSSEPVFSPQMPPSPQLPPQAGNGSAHSKALIISITSVGGLVVVGAAAYFLFFSGSGGNVVVTPPPVVTPPATSEPTPAPQPVPVPDPVPTPDPTPVPPAPTHTSFFQSSSGVISAPINLSSVDQASIKSAISASFSSEVKVPILKELVFSSGNGLMSASAFVNAYLGSDISNLQVENDFTAFAYKDKDGVWPGFVFKLSGQSGSAGPLTSKPDFFSDAEKLAVNFFLTTPGAPNGGFKAGASPSPNFKDFRYLTYAQVGSSFNIAWVQVNGADYMLINTSYNGLKESAKSLGF